jgi:hypothetical protein
MEFDSNLTCFTSHVGARDCDIPDQNGLPQGSNKFKFVSTMSSFPWLRFTAAAIGCAFSLARLNHLKASSSNLPLCMCYHGTPLLSYSPADLATFHINLVLIASACDSFACLRLYSDGYWIRDDERFVSLPA